MCGINFSYQRVFRSVIVIDNARYHNKTVPGKERSTTAWRVAVTKSGLTERNINCYANSTKSELLQIVAANPTEKMYETEHQAVNSGKDINIDLDEEADQ